MGNPLERFIAFLEEIRAKLGLVHGKSYAMCFDPNNPERRGRMQVEEVSRTELRCTLSFVAPSATVECVGTLLEKGNPPHRTDEEKAWS